MKWLVTAGLALGGAILMTGCGSGTIPANPPFSPFGSDPTGASSEPAGTSNEGAAGPGAIDALCALNCGRITTVCGGAGQPNCVGSCESEFLLYPKCAAQAEALLSCLTAAPVRCYGNGIFSGASCTEAESEFQSCINPLLPPPGS
jgi:hypothetical protein